MCSLFSGCKIKTDLPYFLTKMIGFNLKDFCNFVPLLLVSTKKVQQNVGLFWFVMKNIFKDLIHFIGLRMNGESKI